MLGIGGVGGFFGGVAGFTPGTSSIDYVGGRIDGYGGSTGEGSLALSSLSGGLASSPSTGDLVIVGWSMCGNMGDKDMYVTTGWHEVADLFQTSTGGALANFGIFYKFMGTSVDATCVVNSSNSTGGRAGFILVFRGVDQTSPLDVAAVTATGSGIGLPTIQGIAPATSGSIILPMGMASASAVFTQGGELDDFLSAWGDGSGTDVALGVGQIIYGSGSGYVPTQWTGGAGVATDNTWIASTLALRPSSGALAAGTALEWRISVDTSVQSTINFSAFCEIELRATASGADITGTGSAYSSSNFSGSFLPGNAVDNNNSSMWHSASESSPKWRYLFTSPVSINEISIKARNDTENGVAPRKFDVQYYDGSTWQTWWSESGHGAWTTGEVRVFTK